jgi:hypothetical protein
MNHKYSKLARYQNLALVPNRHGTPYFQQVGKHSQMTSVELGNYQKYDDATVINRHHFFQNQDTSYSSPKTQ